MRFGGSDSAGCRANCEEINGPSVSAIKIIDGKSEDWLPPSTAGFSPITIDGRCELLPEDRKLEIVRCDAKRQRKQCLSGRYQRPGIQREDLGSVLSSRTYRVTIVRSCLNGSYEIWSVLGKSPDGENGRSAQMDSWPA